MASTRRRRGIDNRPAGGSNDQSETDNNFVTRVHNCIDSRVGNLQNQIDDCRDEFKQLKEQNNTLINILADQCETDNNFAAKIHSWNNSTFASLQHQITYNDSNIRLVVKDFQENTYNSILISIIWYTLTNILLIYIYHKWYHE